MRQSNSANPSQAKAIARARYASRQIDKFIKWSISQRGYVKYSDIVELHKKYNINVY